MKTQKKKLVLTIMIGLALAGTLTSCKPSEKKVKQSSYYKELKEKYEKLEKENKALQSQVDEDSKYDAQEERISKYLTKIARDHLDKLEVGYADNMEGSEFIEDTNTYTLATGLAMRASKTDKYTVEQLNKVYDPVYEYILYDENNAIYEMIIYEGDYVVMTDLPNDVFYCYNASALGEAFLHYKNGYPNSKLLHRLADSLIVSDNKGNCYEANIAAQAANTIDRMEKKKSNRDKAEAYWKKHYKKNKEGTYEPASTVYTFYHHGNSMKLTLYDVYLRIENMDGKASWYKVNKKDIAQMKNVFALSNTAEAVISNSNFSYKSSASEESSTATTEHAHDIDE